MYVVLDYITNAVGLFSLPQGGKLGLGTVAILLASYHLGWKKGLLTCAVTLLLMYVTGSMNWYGLLPSLLLDYLLAYMGYGLASLFPNFGFFYTGILITSIFRFICSTASGMICYGADLAYSMSYQAGYMVPTCILDLIMVPLLYQALKPVIKNK
jgi:thiamine transporter